MNENTVIWLNRCIVFIILCLNAYILKRDCSKRIMEKAIKNISIYEKMLNIWSLFTMISCLLTSVLNEISLIPLRIFCVYSSKISIIFVFNNKCFLTFYQIARLQYCFMDKTNEYYKYGHSKWIFYILYTIGIYLVLNAVIANWLFIEYELRTYKCYVIEPDHDNQVYYMMKYSMIPIYYLWDWTVLLLYIIPVIKIKKETESSNKNIIAVKKRVNITLHKIILLTILYEIISLIIGIDVYRLLIIQPFASSFIIYLMLRRNHKEYLKILSILYKVKICCCFNCLMRDTLDDMIKQKKSINTKQYEEETVATTKTEDIIKKPIENDVTITMINVSSETNNKNDRISKTQTINVSTFESQRTTTSDLYG